MFQIPVFHGAAQTERVVNRQLRALRHRAVQIQTRDSVILLEQVRTLDKSRLRERMGRLDEPAMHQVDNAIAVSFGLPQ